MGKRAASFGPCVSVCTRLKQVPFGSRPRAARTPERMEAAGVGRERGRGSLTRCGAPGSAPGRQSRSAEDSAAPRAASRLPPRSRGGREGVGGGRGAGRGPPGGPAALTSPGARFGLERFKTGACERRCCSAPSRPPAAAALTAPAAAAARAAPGPRAAAGTRQGPGALLLGGPALPAPAEPQKPAELRLARHGLQPGRPSPLAAEVPLPGHHGHLLGRRSPVLAGPAAAGGRGRLAQARHAAAGVPRALSVRAGRQDAAQGGLLRPGAFGAALQPQCLHFLPVSAPRLCFGKRAEGGRQAGPPPVFGALRLPRAVEGADEDAKGGLVRRVWAPGKHTCLGVARRHFLGPAEKRRLQVQPWGKRWCAAALRSTSRQVAARVPPTAGICLRCEHLCP